MTIARDKILPPASAGPVWVHAISRCVRKAFLCGGRDGRWNHRRGWVESRLCLLSGVFAVEVAAYAVMSNHLHVVLRLRPDVAAGWDAVGVVTRWRSVYAKRYGPTGEPLPPDAAMVAVEAQDAAFVARCRERLADLGWLMKALKEGIAKRANREDGCTGAFWEGRYTSVPLLDL